MSKALAEQALALVDQHREYPFRSLEWLGDQLALATFPNVVSIRASASAMSARSAETEGLSPKDASAVAESETP